MVAGANKVFCGTENGVCELTKDTVYVHPSDKQCSWTPSSTGSPFTRVASFSSGQEVKFTLSNITSTGMYYLQWALQLTSSKYSTNVLSAHTYTSTGTSGDCFIHGTSIPNHTNYIYTISAWINVTYLSTWAFSMVIDGMSISEGNNQSFASIELRLSVGAGQLYNGNSFYTSSATLYRVSP